MVPAAGSADATSRPSSRPGRLLGRAPPPPAPFNSESPPRPARRHAAGWSLPAAARAGAAEARSRGCQRLLSRISSSQLRGGGRWEARRPSRPPRLPLTPNTKLALPQSVCKSPGPGSTPVLGRPPVRSPQPAWPAGLVAPSPFTAPPRQAIRADGTACSAHLHGLLDTGTEAALNLLYYTRPPWLLVRPTSQTHSQTARLSPDISVYGDTWMQDPRWASSQECWESFPSGVARPGHPHTMMVSAKQPSLSSDSGCDLPHE